MPRKVVPHTRVAPHYAGDSYTSDDLQHLQHLHHRPRSPRHDGSSNDVGAGAGAGVGGDIAGFNRDTERQALLQLERARAKPVAFAVRTNAAFDGSLDDDSPVHGCAVSFAMGDYLHVMERWGRGF